jgi:hypothetical protein
MDVKPKKGRYTWTNKRMGPGHTIAKLNVFLLHSYFMETSLSISSFIIPWYSSNHNPISLDIQSTPN